MNPLLIVFLGGGLGAALRYLVNQAMGRLVDIEFPLGIMAINISGSVIMGLAVGDQDALGQQPGEHGMELDGPLAAAEFGPGKDRSAEIDGGGIDDFDGRGFGDPELLSQLSDRGQSPPGCLGVLIVQPRNRCLDCDCVLAGA